jgi:hypothetical protein
VSNPDALGRCVRAYLAHRSAPAGRLELEKECAMRSPSMLSRLILVGSEIAVICDTLDWAAAETSASSDSYIHALRRLFPTSPEELAKLDLSVSDISYTAEPIVPIDASDQEVAALCGLLGAHAAHFEIIDPNAIRTDAEFHHYRASQIREVIDQMEGLL